MTQKQDRSLQSQDQTQQTGPSSMVQSRDRMQDLVGNQAILDVMREEMSAEDCSRYEMWVPEIQRCLAIGAAPPSPVANALMAIIGAKLLGWVTGGYLGTTASTPMVQNILRGTSAQVGSTLGGMTDFPDNRTESVAAEKNPAVEPPSPDP